MMCYGQCGFEPQCPIETCIQHFSHPNLRRGAEMYSISTYRLVLYTLKPPPGGLGVVSSKILMPFSLNCANLFIAEQLFHSQKPHSAENMVLFCPQKTHSAKNICIFCPQKSHSAKNLCIFRPQETHLEKNMGIFCTQKRHLEKNIGIFYTQKRHLKKNILLFCTQKTCSAMILILKKNKMSVLIIHSLQVITPKTDC